MGKTIWHASAERPPAQVSGSVAGRPSANDTACSRSALPDMGVNIDAHVLSTLTRAEGEVDLLVENLKQQGLAVVKTQPFDIHQNNTSLRWRGREFAWF